MKVKLLPQTRKAWLRFALVWAFVMFVAFIFLRGMVEMPGRSWSGPLPDPGPDQRAMRDGLAKHVRTLAGDIGERNVENPDRLDAAAVYIESRLRAMGYEPVDQRYQANDSRGVAVTVRNIEAETTGTELPGEIVVVGAHYDSLRGTPGANDNASGVAALLELARAFSGRRCRRTLRFVAFVNEEPPFFWTRQMGSRVYARRCREQGDDIVGALILETIGYYSDEPGSQKHPPLLGLFYPDKGDFIGFVGNTRSKALVHTCIETFRRTAKFPSEGLAGPSLIPGVGSSDQWAFWKEGYRAVMVTDTAPYRYPDYHLPSDTPDKIDYERTARVTVGLGWVIAELAGLVVEEGG